MRIVLDQLYEQLYQAKAKKDLVAEKEISNKINEMLLLTNDNLSRVALFKEKMRKKKFMKTYSNLLQGEDVSDIEIAKMITSFITHSLIEMEHTGYDAYTDLLIPEQVILLHQFLLGEVRSDVVREFYIEYSKN